MKNEKYARGEKTPRENPAREVTRPAPADDGTVVSGRNAVMELLRGERDIEKMYVRSGEPDGSLRVILAMAAERRIPISTVENTRLSALCGQAHHQGVVAIAAARNYDTVDDILAYAAERGEPPFLLLLDGIEDPHNLGAVLRSAECAGVHGVILPKRRSAGLTPTAMKSAAGAAEHIRIARVVNLARTAEELRQRGVWLYAADMDGTPYYGTDMTGPCALVLGSEGEGISRLVREKCDFVVSIPLYGKINSMNVSAAGAVLLTEIARQRHSKEV